MLVNRFPVCDRIHLTKNPERCEVGGGDPLDRVSAAQARFDVPRAEQ